MAPKRKKLTISDKLNVINEVAANPKVPRVEMARRLGLPASTLSKIMLSKGKIKDAELKCGAQAKKRKNMKLGANVELEKILMEWFQEMRSENVPISGPILQEKANEIARHLNIDNFKASNGWLHRFKLRHDVGYRVVSGESGSVSQDSVDHWINESLPALLNGYEMKDIFNADETALFHSLLPDKSLNIRGEACTGGKKSRERLTVLLCCNADGTEKLAPLVIGKYAKPRCFKNTTTLPCKYTNNSNAWMTAKIFLTFLHQFDASMGSANRKVLLFVDRCPAHPPDTAFLKNVKVAFFPANCTSRLQPLDLGVIHSLKTKYRKSLVQKAIASIEKKSELKLNVLQAMHMVVSSWNALSSTTIVNCFRKAGFTATPILPEEEDENEISEDDWRKLSSEIEFRDFVTCDDTVLTTSRLSIEELCNTPGKDKGNEDSSSDEEVEEETSVPTFGEAVAGFETVRRYMCSFKLDDASLVRLHQIERELLFIRHTRPPKQRSLLDYLQK